MGLKANTDFAERGLFNYIFNFIQNWITCIIFIKRFALEEALALELFNPSFSTVLRHVVLVILVTQEANKLAITFRLGGSVIITIGGSSSHHLAASARKQIVELASSIAVVLTVRSLVTHAKDSNVLSRQIKVGEGLVKPGIPLSSRALCLLVRVPGRCADDDGVQSLNGIVGRITYVGNFKSCRLSDVPGQRLGVARLRGVVDAHVRVERRRTPRGGSGCEGGGARN